MTDDRTPDDKLIPISRIGASTHAARIESDVVGLLSEALCQAEDDPIDAADREAIEDEHQFIERFGFDAPRHRRQQILELKYSADLTDREIRHLYRAGSLVFGINGAHISATTVVVAWGWFQLTCLVGLMVLAFLATIQSTQLTAVVLTRFVGLEGIFLACIWGALYIYVWPRKIMRRARAQ